MNHSDNFQLQCPEAILTILVSWSNIWILKFISTIFAGIKFINIFHKYSLNLFFFNFLYFLEHTKGRFVFVILSMNSSKYLICLFLPETTCGLHKTWDYLQDSSGNCQSENKLHLTYCSGGCGDSMTYPMLSDSPVVKSNNNCKSCVGNVAQVREAIVTCIGQMKKTMYYPEFWCCKCTECKICEFNSLIIFIMKLHFSLMFILTTICIIH